MNFPQIFTASGLFIDALGAAILIFPNLKKTRNIDDDYITSTDKATGEYAQRKHILERKRNLWGLGLLIAGFLLQLIGALI